MRQRRASASNGALRPRSLRASREVLLLVGLALVAIWIVWAFAQEVFLSYQLTREASDLKNQNAALQLANEGYRRDIAAVSSGGAAEEEARLNGYVRSDEKLYVVSQPTTAGAQPRSGGSGAGAAAQAGVVRQAWDWLTHSGRRL
jgi:type II secretory pathway pseudopilin PulG